VHARSIGVGVFAVGLGFALVLLRGEPYVASDQGVFLSVAGRLLDGDSLYAQVFDNKDPLFFYTYAAAFWAGGWRGPFLLDALWLAAAGSSMALLLRELRAPRVAVLTGLVVYPLALTAGWYFVGLSMLGALAVAPLVPWLWVRGWYAASGAVLVAAALMKLNLAPLVAAPLAAFLAAGIPSAARRRALGRCILGAAAATLGAGAVLGLRGELREYLETFAYNVHYAGARSEADSVTGRLTEHLRVAWDFFHLAGRWQLPAAILVLVVFAAAAYLAATRGSRSERALAAAGVATLAGALVVLALTAYGEEHLQLLAYPATIVAVALVWRADELRGGRWSLIVAGCFVVFAVWSSLKVAAGTEISSLWTSRPISPGAIALERARARFAADEQFVGYMVLGSTSEGGHAAFIERGAFDLRCRFFQLYDFSLDEQFDETVECGERERPRFVLVTLGFQPYAGASAWNAFVVRARRLLDERYELVEEEHPGVQVWKLRST
jgi:hypothetical protein